MLFLLSLFISISLGIQVSNYDGTSLVTFDASLQSWGIEYNIGLCNNNEISITLDIDITTLSNDGDILYGFGTQNTFFGLFMGMSMCISISIYIIIGV